MIEDVIEIELKDVCDNTNMTNNIGELSVLETSTTILGQTKSISQNEFYQAAVNGFKPDLCVIVNSFEYSNQLYAVIGNERFKIYRVYHNLATEKTELYLKSEVGETNVVTAIG